MQEKNHKNKKKLEFAAEQFFNILKIQLEQKNRKPAMVLIKNKNEKRK
jgi:hypothetical protein